MPLEPITTHAAQAVEQLPAQRRRPKFEAFVRLLSARIQALEDVFWEILGGRLLDSAVGAQLDVLGAIVGVERGGLDDDAFRLLVRVRIRLNRSAGTGDDVLEVFRLLLGSDANTLALHDYPPASFELHVGGELPVDDARAARILRDVRAVGVGGVLVWSAHPDDDTFAFSDATGAATIEGDTFGDATDGSAGGYFASAAA